MEIRERERERERMYARCNEYLYVMSEDRTASPLLTSIRTGGADCAEFFFLFRLENIVWLLINHYPNSTEYRHGMVSTE